MKNVTITLDEKVAQWARVEAAKAGKSLSRWIGEQLDHTMRSGLSPAKAAAHATLRDFIYGPGYPGVAENLPTREELYDRPSLRRYERAGLQSGPSGFHEEGSGGPTD